jgi:hypothetical protein
VDDRSSIREWAWALVILAIGLADAIFLFWLTF